MIELVMFAMKLAWPCNRALKPVKLTGLLLKTVCLNPNKKPVQRKTVYPKLNRTPG